MSIHQHKRNTHSRNPQQTNWLNVLPPLEGKHVLKFGTKNVENIKSLADYDCESLICVGPKTFDFYSPTLAYCQSLEFLEKNKFDICLIDENDFFLEIDSLEKFREKLHEIFEFLTDTGILLVGLPTGLHIKYKLFFKSILYKVGFKKIDTFFCDPSFCEPSIIYPFSQERKYNFKILIENSFKEISLKSLSRDFIKCALTKVAPTLNPFLGSLFIARKYMGVNEGTITENLLIANFQNKTIQRKYIYSVWLAKPYLVKQIGLMHYGEDQNKSLLAICKQSNIKYHRSNLIKQEYEKVNLISIHSDEFRANKIILPQPIYFGMNNGKSISIETAIPGRSLEEYKKRFPNGRLIPLHKSMLDELVSIQIFLQDSLTKSMKDQLPQISKSYFETSLSLPYAMLCNIERIESYKDYVQHGDFTDTNIIYDDVDKMWGIIDWEWLASGFPYLFDLFYLFVSLGYRENIRKKEPFLDNYFNAVVDTFFKRNWFSDYVKTAVLRYCDQFDLDHDQVFDYFLDFLLFHHNKYQLDYDYPPSAEMYKNLLLFAIENREHYIIH